MNEQLREKRDAIFLKAAANIIRDDIRPLVVSLRDSHRRQNEIYARLATSDVPAAESMRVAEHDEARLNKQITDAIAVLETEAAKDRISARAHKEVRKIAYALYDVFRYSVADEIDDHSFDATQAIALLRNYGIEPVEYD